MEKIHVLILALSAVIAHAAYVTQNKDAIHRRIEQSPCDNCDDHGPPFPPGPHGPIPPPGPYGPLPPPPSLYGLPPPSPPSPSLLLPPPMQMLPASDFFHTRQWSGVTREGPQHGVFSGASASIDGGSQTGSHAFSFASTADDGEIPLLGKFGFGGLLNSGDTDKSEFLGNTQSSNVDVSLSSTSQSSRSNDFDGQPPPQLNNHHAIKSDQSNVGDSESQNEVKYKVLQTSQSGNIDDIKAQSSIHRLGQDEQYTLGNVKNSTSLIGKQYQAAGFSGNAQESGGVEGGQQDSESIVQQSIGLQGALKLADNLSNSRKQSREHTRGQQLSKDFGSDLQSGVNLPYFSSSSQSSQSSKLDSRHPSLSTSNSINVIGQSTPDMKSSSSFQFSNLDSTHSAHTELSNSIDSKGQTLDNMPSPGGSPYSGVDNSLPYYPQLPKRNDFNGYSTFNLKSLISSQSPTLDSNSSHPPLSKSDDFNGQSSAQSKVQTSDSLGSQIRDNVGNFGNSKSHSDSKFVYHEPQSSQMGNSDTVNDFKSQPDIHGQSSDELPPSQHIRKSAEFGSQQKSLEFSSFSPQSGTFGNSYHQSAGYLENDKSVGFEGHPQITDQQTPGEIANGIQQFRGSSEQQSRGLEGIQQHTQGLSVTIQQSRNFNNNQHGAESIENTRQIASDYVGGGDNALGRQQSNGFNATDQQFHVFKDDQQLTGFGARGQHSDNFKNSQQRAETFENSRQCAFDYLSRYDDSLSTCLSQCRIHLQQSRNFGGNDQQSPEIENFDQRSVEFEAIGPRSSNFKNNNQQAGDFENNRQSSAEQVNGNDNGFGSQQDNSLGGNSKQPRGNEDSQVHSGGLGNAGQLSGNIKNTQQQAASIENVGQIKSTSEIGGFDNGLRRGGYKSQATQKDAPNMANQDLGVARQTECSCCNKNSYALSNSESDSGNTFAVSLTD